MLRSSATESSVGAGCPKNMYCHFSKQFTNSSSHGLFKLNTAVNELQVALSD